MCLNRFRKGNIENQNSCSRLSNFVQSLLFHIINGQLKAILQYFY